MGIGMPISQARTPFMGTSNTLLERKRLLAGNGSAKEKGRWRAPLDGLLPAIRRSAGELLVLDALRFESVGAEAAFLVFFIHGDTRAARYPLTCA